MDLPLSIEALLPAWDLFSSRAERSRKKSIFGSLLQARMNFQETEPPPDFTHLGNFTSAALETSTLILEAIGLHNSFYQDDTTIPVWFCTYLWSENWTIRYGPSCAETEDMWIWRNNTGFLGIAEFLWAVYGLLDVCAFRIFWTPSPLRIVCGM